jgi:2-polyprenyl-3-methyl-5-hydroxy-6-metoxy-1,4-benzoquinol methylase
VSREASSLATREFWEELWGKGSVRTLRYNPERGAFSGMHALLKSLLPRDSRLKLLEVGCYPGRFMWYFNRCFGYRVEGIDYIGWCCARTRELLSDEGVEAGIRHLDFLAWEPGEEERWDVVASFGFVEHFEDYPTIIEKHARLVRPGGWLVLEVPNHTGFYGRLLHLLQPQAWNMHNRMGLEQLEAAANAAPGMGIIAARGCGKFSLGHIGLLERSRRAGALIHFAARGFIMVVENVMRLLPEIRQFCPYLVVVARKTTV